MASIRKRNLLGIAVLLALIMIRILLYYLSSQKGLTLTSPYIYSIIDISIIVSVLIFVYDDKKIRRIVYIIVFVLVIINIIFTCNEMRNTERIFVNSKTSKNSVIIQIKNEEVGSEIYVYEREYGIFSKIKDIMYNEGEVAFNTKMVVRWINDKLLSITYKDNNQTVEKIVYFGPKEKIYRNVLDSIEGTWQGANGDSLVVNGSEVEYKDNGENYIYPIDSADEQNNCSTILYGDSSKPSISIVKENNESILVDEVSFANNEEILMTKK
ncbi:MAG: hypothetical protein ACRDAU_09360 [Clostridium sp.]